jgi:hypothetical protein
LDAGHEGVQRVVAGCDEVDAAGVACDRGTDLDSYDRIPNPTDGAENTEYYAKYYAFSPMGACFSVSFARKWTFSRVAFG